MRRLLPLALALVLACLFAPASAACWECSDDKECEAPASGEEGEKECLAYQVCDVICEEVCDTGGGTCESGGPPTGPETWGLTVPNGEPLATPPTRLQIDLSRT